MYESTNEYILYYFFHYQKKIMTLNSSFDSDISCSEHKVKHYGTLQKYWELLKTRIRFKGIYESLWEKFKDGVVYS